MNGPVVSRRSRRVWRVSFLPAVVVVTLAAAVTALGLHVTVAEKRHRAEVRAPASGALPTALAAVGHRGHFLGVRLLSLKAVDLSLRHHQDAELPNSLAAAGATMLCRRQGPSRRNRSNCRWPRGRKSAAGALVLVNLAARVVS